jgi:type III restriction enzyme
LSNGLQVMLEVKGQAMAETEAKHQAAKRWVSAVNHWGQLGQWRFEVCWDPQKLGHALRSLVPNLEPAAT